VGSNAPVEALVKYLSAHPQTLYSIPARKLEEVAQAVLCEFYRCEVRHVGRTGDGGIDLLVINSDNPIAVQVKRRMKSGKAEGVQLIREFLGAIQLEGLKEAIIVSTADRFTTGAVGAAERAVQGKLVRNYRLIDFPSLIDLLNLKRGSVPKPLRVLGISDW
jgi:HJR/Mrr/RecB family endonuclease